MLSSRRLFACLLALLPVFCACTSGDAAGAGTASSSKPNKVARARIAEHSQLLSVPDMGDVISANRASKALLAIQSVTGVDTSVRHKTITVTSDGVVAPIKLIQALSKVGLFASIAR